MAMPSEDKAKPGALAVEEASIPGGPPVVRQAAGRVVRRRRPTGLGEQVPGVALGIRPTSGAQRRPLWVIVAHMPEQLVIPSAATRRSSSKLTRMVSILPRAASANGPVKTQVPFLVKALALAPTEARRPTTMQAAQLAPGPVATTSGAAKEARMPSTTIGRRVARVTASALARPPTRSALGAALAPEPLVASRAHAWPRGSELPLMSLTATV
mmetsp:Transcript_46353/g.100793  ORF Transcript_46353/g.100793 Transcript_46353/m.100793 type:complete len:213 (-) Transcript_46353:14-652(-)